MSNIELDMSDSPYSQTHGGSYGSSESLARRDDLDSSKTTTLEKLLDYLLAAKRSLSSTNHVWRANEIVNSARDALTEAVIIQARSGFLKHAIVEQLRVLTGVKNGVEQVARHGREDFEVRSWPIVRPRSIYTYMRSMVSSYPE